MDSSAHGYWCLVLTPQGDKTGRHNMALIAVWQGRSAADLALRSTVPRRHTLSFTSAVHREVRNSLYLGAIGSLWMIRVNYCHLILHLQAAVTLGCGRYVGIRQRGHRRAGLASASGGRP
ncbi:unnamed protein product [Merluccius merluccius]